MDFHCEPLISALIITFPYSLFCGQRVNIFVFLITIASRLTFFWERMSAISLQKILIFKKIITILRIEKF